MVSSELHSFQTVANIFKELTQKCCLTKKVLKSFKKRLLIYLDKICKLDTLQILSPQLVSLARRACLKVLHMPCGYLNCLTRRGECQLCFHPNLLATLTCSTCCRVHELCISLCLLFCIITIRLGDCLLQKKPW